MFSFIKKWRRRKIREEITLRYLSNVELSKEKSVDEAIIYINTLYVNICNPHDAIELLSMDDFVDPR